MPGWGGWRSRKAGVRVWGCARSVFLCRRVPSRMPRVGGCKPLLFLRRGYLRALGWLGSPARAQGQRWCPATGCFSSSPPRPAPGLPEAQGFLPSRGAHRLRGCPLSLLCLSRAPSPHFLWVWVLLRSAVPARVLLRAAMNEWSPKPGFVCLFPAALLAALALQSVCFSGSCWLPARLEHGQG